MSEVLSDDALEAAALAAIDDAEGEKPAAAAKEEGEKPEAKAKDPDAGAQIIEAARKAGWKPKEEFEGPADKWSDAPEYILLAAGELLPTLKTRLDEARTEIKGLKAAVKTSIAHMSKADERAYTKARADLEAELEQYATAGNAKAVKEVTDDIVALDREAANRPKPDDTPDEPPEMVAWREANPWYGTDEAHSAACDAIGNAVFKDGYTGKAQIAEVDKRMREKFPGLFAKPTNPNRALPGAVEGGTVVRRQGGKSFSDMPREHQDMCADMMKLSKSITREGYAREYFADQEQAR